MLKFEFNYNWVAGGLCLVCSGSYSKPVPAKLYGAPEDCYPEEGGEVELELCLIDGEVEIFASEVIDHIDSNGKPVMLSEVIETYYSENY